MYRGLLPLQPLHLAGTASLKSGGRITIRWSLILWVLLILLENVRRCIAGNVSTSSVRMHEVLGFLPCSSTTDIIVASRLPIIRLILIRSSSQTKVWLAELTKPLMRSYWNNTTKSGGFYTKVWGTDVNFFDQADQKLRLFMSSIIEQQSSKFRKLTTAPSDRLR